MKLGSLFDGSGGFPLAGSLCGIEPVWASEVEPYPIAVTKSRFPNMKHLGSVTDVHGGDIEPVDIITFGSPCQDLSVAGKRAGLKHEANGDDETTRSGLFMEAVRIIKEMRKATNGEYPTFAVWENVQGAFSSNKGEDFRIVLEELIKIVEPEAVMPAVPAKGWAYADSYIGDGWSLAYRVFDAQYWGVPQRRRRIHLVLDLGGKCAREILFEREGLRGYFAEGGTTWQGAAGDAESGIGADDREGNCLTPWDYQSKRVFALDGAMATLPSGERSGQNQQSVFVPIAFAQNQREEVRTLRGVAVALNAEPGTHQQTYILVPQKAECSREVLPFDTTQVTSPQNGCNPKFGDPCHPLAAQGHPPTVCCKCYDSRGNGDGQTVSTLTGDHENRITDYTSVVVAKSPIYCLQGNAIGRADTAGCDGKGWKEDASYTLNTIDRHAVAFTGQSLNFSGAVRVQYIVRRLTPTECARLQGFPDNWGEPDKKDDFTDEEYQFWLDVRNTHAAINGKAQKGYTKSQILTWYNKLHTDSAEYKMWGNGIALPPALYCMQGIVEAMRNEIGG